VQAKPSMLNPSVLLTLYSIHPKAGHPALEWLKQDGQFSLDGCMYSRHPNTGLSG
jgi:hypothetical protein